MPKGAKKRKAAKRKKQQEASNDDNSASINSHNPQGNDDPKSQDEGNSDDGEVRSPVAQDHHSDQHLFYKDNEGPDEVMPSSVQSALPENTTDATRNSRGNKLAPGDDDLVKIEGVLSYQQDSNNNSVAIQHVESTNESHDGDERSSNSSSSCSEDEDSAAVEKKGKEEACSAVEIKAVDAFPERVALISEYEKSVKNNDNAVAETVLDVNLDEPVVHISEMVKHESSQVENPEVLDVVESGLKESEVQLPPASSEDSAISIVAPMNDENKILPTSEEKSTISVGSTMCRNNDKMFTSTDAHPTEATNDSANIKYSDASKYAENQPLIASAPWVSQRTSWMSCCGLFDAFTGSGR